MFNLLIVDDEDIIVDGLQLLIPWNELGVRIIATATSGEDALTIIDQHKIDILLTDISMDELSGLDLIEQLKQQQPLAKSIVLSGFNEFEYIKRGLKLGIENYLLKPVNKNELLQTIATITETLRFDLEDSTEKDVMKEHITKRIFFNQIAKNEFLERASLLKLDLPNKNCHACILKWRNNHLSEQQNSGYQQIAACFNKLGIAYLTQIETTSVGFLLDHRSLTTLRKQLHTLESELNDLPFIDSFMLYIGIERPLFHQFHLSIESAETLQEHFSLISNNTSHFYDELANYQRNDSALIQQELFAQFDSAIDLRDKTAIEDQITEVFQPAMSVPTSSTYLTNIAYMMMLKLFQGFYKVYLDEFQEYAKKLAKTTQLEEIITLLHEGVDQVFSQSKALPYSQITHDVIATVNSHYQESLSLKSISLKLHVNTAYLGQLFQKELGVSFSEYLNNYRMQIAKQQLMHSVAPIETIAFDVGFKDVSYFSRKFKQLTNQTPHDYRHSK